MSFLECAGFTSRRTSLPRWLPSESNPTKRTRMSEAMELLLGFMVVAILAGYFIYLLAIVRPRNEARRRAENKVRMSDPILRSDIDALAKGKSEMLD